jgi:hypothetical protein
VISEVRETIPYWLKLSSALILVLFFLFHLLDRYRLRKLKSRKNQFITDFPSIDARTKTRQGAVLVKSNGKSNEKKD